VARGGARRPTAMMRVLLAKELRALRPFALGIVGLFVGTVIYAFATELPDEQVLRPETWLEEDRGGYFILLALFALMIGAGLLIHESEQGTLRFLDGLPVTRTKIFVAKALAGWVVVSLVTLLGLPLDALCDGLSRSSWDGPFPWSFIGAQAWLQGIAAAYLLALALAFSFFRHWFALIVGLLFLGYLWLRQTGLPYVGLFDPGALLAVGLDDRRVLVPWSHVAVQAGATAGLLGLAWLGFLSLGDRAQFAAERLGKWRILRALGAGLRWLAPVIWLVAIGRLVRTTDDGEHDDPAVPLGERAFARRETAHYEFLFRSAQRTEATPLIAAADEVHDEVAAFFAAAASPARIVVDLASPVMPHAAGQTNWTKIRMPLTAGQDLAERKLILGHETAHVFIEQLSDGRLGALFKSARFFHEGLATYVEQRHFGGDTSRAQNRRSVAGAWSRGRVPFDLLCDDATLTRQRDPTLVYPLGEVLVRTLVETHGAESVARSLRALARRDAPLGLDGAALWRDTLQAAGLDLDRVAAGYESACAAIVAEEQEFLARLPRLSATVGVEAGEIVIRPMHDGTPPGEVVCLIEVAGPLITETPALSRRAEGSFATPRNRLTTPTVRYLLGWRTRETRLPVFEPWAEAAL